MTTCALVAACDFNADHFKSLYDAGVFDEVYAVDAGFAHLEALGVAPDLAIGDFDSLGYVPAARRVARHPVKKDKSDLELAFDRALSRHYSQAYVYGALGGRLDHTVANLQMCARFAEAGIDVAIVGLEQTVRILVGPDACTLPMLESGVVSVFSATDASHGVTERGMEYPLDGATLTNRTTLGLSNELKGEEAAVAVEEGTLFVFHPAAPVPMQL